jgi:natural product precursor
MKNLSKLKLNILSNANLLEKEMNGLRGGNVCTCSCQYANNGGSSDSSNMHANYNIGGGGYSTGGCNQYGWGDGMGANEIAYCSTCNESNPGYNYIL